MHGEHTFNTWWDAHVPPTLRTHFSARELTHNVRTGRAFDIPPPKQYANILPTLAVAHRARVLLAEPIYVTSAYRSPATNARTPDAAPFSQHTEFNALDITIQDAASRPETFQELINILLDLRDTLIECPFVGIHRVTSAPHAPLQWWKRIYENEHAFRWLGGLGIYDAHAHIDTRGINATWRTLKNVRPST